MWQEAARRCWCGACSQGRVLNLQPSELDRLRAWKREALAVLAEWEKVWEAAGRPGVLGESKATAVRRLLEDAYYTVDNDVWCERCGEDAGDCRCGQRKALVIG